MTERVTGVNGREAFVLPQTSAEGATISLPIQATDVDAGTTLTYSATGLPTGLAIDDCGVISGTLGYATAGTGADAVDQ